VLIGFDFITNLRNFSGELKKSGGWNAIEIKRVRAKLLKKNASIRATLHRMMVTGLNSPQGE
jgi:hypothetical protein